MEDHNSLGFIFFLFALSLGFVAVTGIAKQGMAADATPDEKRNLMQSLVTLPALGIVLTLSYPHYTIGLVGAGLVLGFVLTLNRITIGLSALGTEPTAVGILYLMARRGARQDAVPAMEEVLAGFGYNLTHDHLGFLTGGILAGIVLGVIPRLILKSRALRQEQAPPPKRKSRVEQLTGEAPEAGRPVLSRKVQKSGLADRIRSVS